MRKIKITSLSYIIMSILYILLFKSKIDFFYYIVCISFFLLTFILNSALFFVDKNLKIKGELYAGEYENLENFTISMFIVPSVYIAHLKDPYNICVLLIYSFLVFLGGILFKKESKIE